MRVCGKKYLKSPAYPFGIFQDLGIPEPFSRNLAAKRLWNPTANTLIVRAFPSEKERLRRENPKVASRLEARKRKNGNKIRGSKPGEIAYVHLSQRARLS